MLIANSQMLHCPNTFDAPTREFSRHFSRFPVVVSRVLFLFHCCRAGEPRDEPSEGAELPPAEAPRDYVIALYDSYAETFDAHLEGALEYRTPTIVMGTVASLLPRRR